LACEARFFLDQYRLSRLENPSSYSVYADADNRIHLIVSGVGKVRSAAALSYLHALTGCLAHTVYLNIGIAGARDRAIGELLFAHKIKEANTARVFYPFPMLLDELSSSTVITVDQPLMAYPDDALIEMEAAGFHQAALNMVTQEQVQTLKIISDNRQQPDQINPNRVIDLFQQNTTAIQPIIDFLLDFSAGESKYFVEPAHCSDFTKRFHFTHYQQNQLRELLRRWQINHPTTHPLQYCLAAKTAAEVLISLNNSLTMPR